MFIHFQIEIQTPSINHDIFKKLHTSSTLREIIVNDIDNYYNNDLIFDPLDNKISMSRDSSTICQFTLNKIR